MYFFLKAWEKLYTNILINTEGLAEVNNLIKEGKHNVVLLPTHKSFMDLWILGMINLDHGIEYPFNYGEQSLVKLAVVDTLLKNTGSFKLNPSLKKNELF